MSKATWYGVNGSPGPDDHEYPNKTDFQCDWVDYESDMYPEFAPDPLEIACDNTATVIMAWFDQQYGGLPQVDKFCREHADRWESDEENQYWPTPEHSRLELHKA